MCEYFPIEERFLTALFELIQPSPFDLFVEPPETSDRSSRALSQESLDFTGSRRGVEVGSDRMCTRIGAKPEHSFSNRDRGVRRDVRAKAAYTEDAREECSCDNSDHLLHRCLGGHHGRIWYVRRRVGRGTSFTQHERLAK